MMRNVLVAGMEDPGEEKVKATLLTFLVWWAEIVKNMTQYGVD